MNYYTNFETSVALREAGAEQRPDGLVVMTWDTEDGDEPILIDSLCSEEDSPRAFRLDEILEALEKLVPESEWICLESPLGCADDIAEWTVTIRRGLVSSDGGEHNGPTPVEAAAACYLAVLRAAREVAR